MYSYLMGESLRSALNLWEEDRQKVLFLEKEMKRMVHEDKEKTAAGKSLKKTQSEMEKKIKNLEKSVDELASANEAFDKQYDIALQTGFLLAQSQVAENAPAE
ncbi:hypothetical protein ACOSP7_000165 [Xanthoceras sorbifolium]